MINTILNKIWDIQGKYPNINLNINKKYIEITITGKDSGGATRHLNQRLDISEILSNGQILDFALEKQIRNFNHELHAL